MTFDNTYAEYRWLRWQLGFAPWLAMVPSVWNFCSRSAQEEMLQGLREALAETLNETNSGLVDSIRVDRHQAHAAHRATARSR